MSLNCNIENRHTEIIVQRYVIARSLRALPTDLWLTGPTIEDQRVKSLQNYKDLEKPISDVASDRDNTPLDGQTTNTDPYNLHPNREMAERVFWDIISLNAHLQSIRALWARALKITGPQWLILSAIKQLDHNKGVSVTSVSGKLLVDPSFVTTQSKALEKLGLVQRTPSQEDARVVLMTLTDKALKQISNLDPLQSFSESLIFSQFTTETLHDLTATLNDLNKRIVRAKAIVAAEALRVDLI